MNDSLPPASTTTSRRSLLSLGAGLTAAVGLGCQSSPAMNEDSARGAERRAQLDEWFAHLTDQRATETPISNAEHAARRRRLGKLLEERQLHAFVTEGGATMSYLSGISWGHSERLFALVVLQDGSHFWLCPGFEAEKAKLRIKDDPGGEIVTWEEHEYPFAPLSAALTAGGVTRVAIEPSLRYRFVAGLQNAFQGNVLAGMDVLIALRGRKDAHELALLRKANELTQRAIVAVSERLEPGLTGREIGEMIGHAHRRLGFVGAWNLSLIGPAAAYPHGENRSIALERGDVVLIDTGGSFHGYQSDNTRSWVFDAEPSNEVEKVWNTVRDAQQRAFEAIAPGVECRAIDRVARDVIDAAGYGPGYATFTHRLGHGIGMQGHEDPYFDGGSEVVLQPGMTLSDEPGIYLLEKFGVRIEDIVVVTEDGADHFGSWQASPRSPA